MGGSFCFLSAKQIREECTQSREEGVHEYRDNHGDEKRKHASDNSTHRQTCHTDRSEDIDCDRRRGGADNQSACGKNAVVDGINPQRLCNGEHQREQQQRIGVGVHEGSEDQENHEGEDHKGNRRGEHGGNPGNDQRGQALPGKNPAEGHGRGDHQQNDRTGPAPAFSRGLGPLTALCTFPPRAAPVPSIKRGAMIL